MTHDRTTDEPAAVGRVNAAISCLSNLSDKC
jgi:hypothetical protein